MNTKDLWQLAILKTSKAKLNESILPFETKLEKYKENNVTYELRSLVGKPKIQKIKYGPKLNPFCPWEKELEILPVNKDHVLILNKYPVEPGHMLLITKQWAPQNGWLVKKDWEALSETEKNIKGLWFFNNSPNAGASQPHRHLQILRRNDYNNFLPRQKWFESISHSQISLNSKIGKSCFVYPRKYYKKKASATELENLYIKLCKKLYIGDPLINSMPIVSYNLLITNKWISLIRRSQESYKGFSINALGFAGYFLVSENSDIEWLKRNNIETLLEAVVKPIN